MALDGPKHTLIKLGFEGVDPRFSDVAYHITDEECLDGIRAQGLRRVDTPRGWGEMIDPLLAAKPPDVPVDLKSIVFGQLENRFLGHLGLPAALRSDISKGEALAVAVDPADTFTGDARVREELAVSPEKSDWFNGDVPRIRELYWRSVYFLWVSSGNCMNPKRTNTRPYLLVCLGS